MSYNNHQRTIAWALLEKQAEALGLGKPYWNIPIVGLIFHVYDKIYGIQEVPFYTIFPLDYWCVDLADVLQASSKESQ